MDSQATKKTPTQVFSCALCENFKNTFFTEHLRTTVSAIFSNQENFKINRSWLFRRKAWRKDLQNSQWNNFDRVPFSPFLLTRKSKTVTERKTVLSRTGSSHRRCFVREGVIRNFAKFTRKHLCQRLLFNEDADLRPATLWKKRHWHRCSPGNFRKFLRKPFFTEHLWATASDH